MNWLEYINNEYGLGTNLDDPASIMSSLSDHLGVNINRLEEGMFTALPQGLLELLNPQHSNAYRLAEQDPLFESFVQQTGLLNQPWSLNTNRHRAMLESLLQEGMTSVSKDVMNRQKGYIDTLNDWATANVGQALKQSYL